MYGAFMRKWEWAKTAIIKHIAQQLNVVDEVNSPTYAIMNEYSTNTNGLVFHFDFYRLKNTSEVYDIGAEDFFLSNNLCLVEWPRPFRTSFAQTIFENRYETK